MFINTLGSSIALDKPTPITLEELNKIYSSSTILVRYFEDKVMTFTPDELVIDGFIHTKQRFLRVFDVTNMAYTVFEEDLKSHEPIEKGDIEYTMTLDARNIPFCDYVLVGKSNGPKIQEIRD